MTAAVSHIVGGGAQTSSPSRPRRIGAAVVSRASIWRTPTSTGAAEGVARASMDAPTSFSGKLLATKSGSAVSRIAQCTFQSRAVLSPLQVRMRLSSFEKTAPETASSCVSAGPICAPVAAFQSRAVLSSLQVRMRVSSFEKTAPTTAIVVRERRPDLRPRRGVPEPRGLVGAPGQDAGLVLREDGARDHVVVRERRTDLRPGRGVPEPRGLSSLQVRMRVSSFEKTAPETTSSCLSAGPICAPVAAFQSRAVLSSLQVRMRRLVLREDGAPDHRRRA